MKIINKPKTRKGINSKKRIFKSAVKLINEKGYDNVSVKDICNYAGIAIGTFYHYFKSKQDILIEYVKFEGEDIEAMYKSLTFTSAFDKLFKVVSYQMEFINEKSKDVFALICAFELTDKNKLFDFSNMPIVGILSNCVNDGQLNGEFNLDYPADFIGMTIFYQLWGIAFIWASSKMEYDIRSKLTDIKIFLESLLYTKQTS